MIVQPRRRAEAAEPRRWRRTDVAFSVLGAALIVLFIAPLAWSTLTSLKPPSEAAASPPTFLPSYLTLDNYRKLIDYGDGAVRYFANSATVAALTVAGTLALSVPAGYGYSRYAFRFKGALFGLTLIVLMVPHASLVIPLYVVLGALGLLNSLVGLSLVLVVFQLPFAVFMMRNSFDTVPTELEEAAIVDGCGTLGVLRHVSLRLVLPGTVTVALFAFLAAWNEFLAAVIFLTDSSRYTLPIMLTNASLGWLGAVDFGALQAGIAMSALPCLVLSVLLQRYYVDGLTAGSVKG